MNLSELMLVVEELCSVTVSLEEVDPALSDCPSLRLAQDQHIHHSEACRAVKFSSEISVCCKNKARSVAIARRGRSFCGRCPNGIWDLAVPVFHHDSLVAVVYLGGGQHEPDAAKRRELRMYGRFIARFLVIELYRHAKRSSSHRKRRDEAFYIENTLRFIEEKYCEEVSLGDLSETLNVNPNYLGKMLHRNLGQTFRDLLCERRMKQAEVLVRLHEMLNFTQIARLCGFSDSNYFSTVFKQKFGLSPRSYRKQYRRI